MKDTVINVLSILLFLGTRGFGYAIDKKGLHLESNVRRSANEYDNVPDKTHKDGLQSVMKRSDLNKGEDIIEGLLARPQKLDGMETDVRRAIDEQENVDAPDGHGYYGLHSIQERNALSKDENLLQPSYEYGPPDFGRLHSLHAVKRSISEKKNLNDPWKYDYGRLQ